MMTKPPGATSPTSFPPEDEEDESIARLCWRTSSSGPASRPVDAVGVAVGDGVEAAVPADAPEAEARPPSEITQITARPPVSDEVVEEETKVEQADILLRAAAANPDAALALTAQASEQRDRALRKGASSGDSPFESNGYASARSDKDSELDSEFEDPDADESGEDSGGDSADAFGAASLTPADIPISDDDAAPPLASNGGGSGGYVATPPSGPASQPRLPPPGRNFTTPPPGRPEAYTNRRLPTPSPDYVAGGSGYGSGAHYPSIAIPAPASGSSSGAVRASVDESKIHLPMRGLAGVLAAAFAGGLLVGALIWRHSSPSASELAAKSEAAKAEAKSESAKAEAKPSAPAPSPTVVPVQPVVAAIKPASATTATTTTTTTTTAAACPAEPAAVAVAAPARAPSATWRRRPRGRARGAEGEEDRVQRLRRAGQARRAEIGRRRRPGRRSPSGRICSRSRLFFHARRHADSDPTATAPSGGGGETPPITKVMPPRTRLMGCHESTRRAARPREPHLAPTAAKGAGRAAQESGERLGYSLTKLGIIDEEDSPSSSRSSTASRRSTWPSSRSIADVLQLVPKERAPSATRCIPVNRAGATLIVAMGDPSNIYAHRRPEVPAPATTSRPSSRQRSRHRRGDRAATTTKQRHLRRRHSATSTTTTSSSAATSDERQRPRPREGARGRAGRQAVQRDPAQRDQEARVATSTSSPTRRASACATASTACSTRRCRRRSS